MQVHSQASITINAPREDVFAFTNDVSKFPQTFQGFGPIPGMDRVVNLNGDETREGTIRNIYNVDGTVLEEHLVAHSAPSEMAYEIVSGLRAPFSWLVRGAGGRWTFADRGDSTDVVWRFRFDLTSPLIYPIGYLVGSVLFRKAQERCLQATKQAIENG